MSANENVEKYLPLTESTFYILLTLVEITHGYGIMQSVEQISEGTVRLGPGTMYGALQTLEKQGLIRMVKEENRRKCFTMTRKGKSVLAGQLERLNIMTRSGQEVMDRLMDFESSSG